MQRWLTAALTALIGTLLLGTVEPADAFAILHPGETASSADYFFTLAPGMALPDGETCARLVRGSAGERRPQNTTPNNTEGQGGVPIDGGSSTAQAYLAPRIDGRFTGTTEEIIRWGACKWGFDEDIIRAIAVNESWWMQSTQGNYEGGSPTAFGLLQVKVTVHENTWPWALESTAFNIDYALAWRRSCYEGYFSHWIPTHAAGDEWGCVGLWNSGEWGNAMSSQYIGEVQSHLSARTWLHADF